MIRPLHAEDARALMALRREALESEPMAFGSSIEDDRCGSQDYVRGILGDGKEQAVFGHFDGEELAGMVGLVRSSQRKERHRAFVWGMYVSPRARNRGAGGALLDAAIRRAREWGVEQVRLGVSEAAPAAHRLYIRAGFRAWGVDPRALYWDGRFTDEHHMVLELKER